MGPEPPQERPPKNITPKSPVKSRPKGIRPEYKETEIGQITQNQSLGKSLTPILK